MLTFETEGGKTSKWAHPVAAKTISGSSTLPMVAAADRVILLPVFGCGVESFSTVAGGGKIFPYFSRSQPP